jgi:hypothetical protein
VTSSTLVVIDAHERPAWWRTDMTGPEQGMQAPGGTDHAQAGHGEDAEGERAAGASPAQQAVVNEEKAFESGEENPS